jgi:ferritin-like metal-binding protein YciE
MKLESLRDLFIEELQDLYSAEGQILETLPDLIEEANSPELKRAFKEHLDQTQEHVKRLDTIFDELGDEVDREDKTCKGMKGILKDGEELMDSEAESEVLDAGMIAAAQRVEHYEIAGYGTVKVFAKLLGQNSWANLLGKTLEEEKQADQKLTQIANRINLEAKAA